MKEQFKAPEKIQPSDKEIANLSDAQFKTLVIRMFKELKVYFNSIKKTQAKKGGYIKWNKEKSIGNQQWRGEAKTQTNDLEHKEGKKTFNRKSRIKNKFKKQGQA